MLKMLKKFDRMRVSRLWLMTWAIAGSLLLAVAAAGQVLNSQIDILLTHTELHGSRIGIFVQDADTGEVLAAHNAGDPFLPASNMKLLTTGAALSVLGPEFTFRTELRRDDDTIVLQGSGDPALADPVLLAEMNLGVEDLLDQWVEAIGRSGDPPPTSLVVDATVFDQQFVHPSWPADQLNRWYAAEVTGLNFYTNVISFYLTKQALHEPPRILLEPSAPWLNINNRARSVDRGQNTVWVARPLGNNNMTVYGDLRQSLAKPIRVAIHNPPAFVGRLMAMKMEAAGMGRPVVEVTQPGQAAPEGETIAVVQTPISTIVRRCNVVSQNLYAEALFKQIGRAVTGQPGSFTNGAAVLRMVMQDVIGPADTAGTTIADGSGLSRGDRVSPRALGRWLRALANDPAIADTFLGSLPVAGKDGTLARRFQHNPTHATVHAKSGYISGVSCLSGYLIDEPSGRTVVFSVLVNDIPQRVVPISRVKEFHEAVVMLADGWLREHLNKVAGAEPETSGVGG